MMEPRSGLKKGCRESSAWRLPIVVLVFFLVAENGWFAGTPLLGQGRRIRPDELRAEDVRKSIRNGVQFLLNRRNPGGGWGDVVGGYPGSGNGLVLLALLNAGVPPTDKAIREGLREFSTRPEGTEKKTYVVSLRVMTIVAAGEAGKPYRKLLEEDVQWLINAQSRRGPRALRGLNIGGWSYGESPGNGDFSNSQYALLALHEATTAGVAVPDEVWQAASEYWAAIRNPEGAFGYSSPVPGNGAMACAGISSLIIIRDNLARSASYLENDRVKCCGEESNDSLLESAQAWMTRHFRVDANPTKSGTDPALYYYLYGLERAGRLSGQRFFGDRDWYREGAAELLNLQSLNGSWVGSGPHTEEVPEVATSFALLFLSKGLRPVLFGRYELPDSGLGQRHPNGIHFLTRQVEASWKMPLNWQTVDARTAGVNDLRESPVLFLSGREALQLDAAQKAALKAYVESGKFLFVEACQGDGCGDNVPFDRSFRELVAELFPESKLEALPADHPVWTAQTPIRPDPEWPLLGLQACCRTSVIFCPRNLSCYWQLDRPALLDDCPPAVREQVAYCRNIGLNVAAYATGRIVEERLGVEKLGESVVTSLKGRALVFPKLRLGGGDDDATSAWKNMLDSAREAAALSIDNEKKSVAPILDQMSDHTLLFAHGRQGFALKDAERDAIRQYIGNGGFLFVDSICTSTPFNDSFRREMRLIFPENALQPIPANDPLWTDPKFGYNLESVGLQRPDPGAPNGFRIERTAPRLEGIAIDGRWVVVFSPFDLSCAMENSTASHCEGYQREDAARIATNILLYRLRAD